MGSIANGTSAIIPAKRRSNAYAEVTYPPMVHA